MRENYAKSVKLNPASLKLIVDGTNIHRQLLLLAHATMMTKY